MQEAVFAHVNIVSTDWRKLAVFYQQVFGCTEVPPPRKQSAPWLARCTGVPNAALEGVHLRLPGHGPTGPTLEIYQYSEVPPGHDPRANHRGFLHIAFRVADVPQALQQVLDAGGSKVGEVVAAEVAGVGQLEAVYAADPEGNILELQRWR